MSLETRLEAQEAIHCKGGACDVASGKKWTAIDAVSNRVTRLETIIWIASIVGPLFVQGLFEIGRHIWK